MPQFAILDWFGDNNNGRYLFEGFLANLEIAIIAMVLAFLLGLVLALLRLSRNAVVSNVAGAWVDVFRNLPLILLILFLALLLPESWRNNWQENVPEWAPEAFKNGLILGAFMALILYNSAVLAEIMRAGIQSLPRGQGEAASALGLTYRQSLRHVILPQGLRRMVPALVSQLITLNKDTTLVSIVAIQEVMRHGRIVTGFNFFGGVPAPVLQVFIFIGLLFIAVNLALSRLSRRLELREQQRSGPLKPVAGSEDVAVQGA